MGWREFLKSRTDGPEARPFASPAAARRAAVGQRGEEAAASWLQRCGWTVLARRSRIAGVEVDILARTRGTLVVVEVKTGLGGGFTSQLESVGEFKQSRLCRAADRLAAETGAPVRIDIIAVCLPDRLGEPIRLRHLENAVEAGE